MSSACDTAPGDRFAAWFSGLERRHLADLTFQEVRRSVQALSARYVERRGDSLTGALSTRGKRAAFALYYAPLHFLTVRQILRNRQIGPSPRRIVDLGCGTGVAGAAWALEAPSPPFVAGFDLNPWAVREARWNLRCLGVQGTAERRDVVDVAFDPASGIVAAFTINELSREHRDAVLGRLSDAAKRGAAVLIVEPISRRPVPWWDDWAGTLEQVGGLADQWRMRTAIPDTLRLMDKAAGLDHGTLTARSILVPNGASR
jgi:ubiquinone/menaquinone biosynthesis C-methylase UbiE